MEYLSVCLNALLQAAVAQTATVTPVGGGGGAKLHPQMYDVISLTVERTGLNSCNAHSLQVQRPVCVKSSKTLFLLTFSTDRHSFVIFISSW